MDILDDPYPTYAAMRTRPGAIWDEHTRRWTVARYGEVWAALSDDRLGSAVQSSRETGSNGASSTLRRLLANQIETSDPPSHDRQRRHIENLLTRRLRPHAEDVVRLITEDIVGGVRATGTVDVVQDVALPIATGVIQGLLGIDDRDFGPFSVAATDVVSDISRLGGSRDSSGRLDESMELAADLISKTARDRPSSFVADLLRLTAAEEQLSRDEAIANVFLIFAAGTGTSASLLASAVRLLVLNPDQLRMFLAEPNLTTSAIEEFLRFDSPIQLVGRTAVADLNIDGAEITQGQEISLLIGSANRDESIFPHGDNLDLTRRPNRHLAFGRGRHTCMGAALARLEARIALPKIMDRFAAARICPGGVAWQHVPSLRGLLHLQIEFVAVQDRGDSRE